MNTSGLYISRMDLRKMRREKFRHKLISVGIAAALIIVIGILLWGGVNYFFTRSPEKTVNNFVEAVQEDNYKKAYQYLDCKGPILTEENFIFAQKTLGTVEEMDVELLKNDRFNLREVRAGQERKYTIDLTNKGNFLFPEWRINSNPFTEVISIFTKTEGAQLISNKKILGTSSGKKPLTYRSFTGHQHTSILQLKGAQDYIFQIPVNSSVEVDYMVTTNELKKILSEIIKQYNHELVESYRDWNTKRLETYLKPGSEGDEWIKENIKSLKDKQIKKYRTLLNLSAVNAYMIDINHAVIEVHETWNDISKPVKLNYLLEKTNSGWKIVTVI